MPPRLKLALVAAVGFALGLAAGARCDRPGVAARPPLITNLRGHAAGDPPNELRPLTLRVGDDLTQVGRPAAARPRVVTVYLDCSGVPVVASFELAGE